MVSLRIIIQCSCQLLLVKVLAQSSVKPSQSVLVCCGFHELNFLRQNYMVENLYKQRRISLVSLKIVSLQIYNKSISFHLLLKSESQQLNTTSKHILSIFQEFNQIRKVLENSFIEKSTFYKETKETK